MNKKLFSIIAFLTIACTTSVFAQSPVLTAEDYARAERMLGYNTSPLVDRGAVRPTFLPDGRFWYQALTPNGREYVLINPADGSRKTAAGLPELIPNNPPLQASGAKPNEILSPDGKKAAYIKKGDTYTWNLWVRDLATGKETQLTTDGVENFGYATDNAGWTHSDRPILLWSPDSKKIATFQQDQRNVGEMYLVGTQVGHPRLEAWKYPLPGDEDVALLHRLVIDVETGKITRLKKGPDQHRSTLCDNIACRGGDWADVYWRPDSRKVA